MVFCSISLEVIDGLFFLLIEMRFFLFGVVLFSLWILDFFFSNIGIILILLFFNVFVWFLIFFIELLDFLLVIIIRIFWVLCWFFVLKRSLDFLSVLFNSVLEFFCKEFSKCFNVFLFWEVVLKDIVIFGIFLNVIIVYWRCVVLYLLISVWMIFFICWKCFLFLVVFVFNVKIRFIFGMVGGFMKDRLWNVVIVFDNWRWVKFWIIYNNLWRWWWNGIYNISKLYINV